MKRVGIFSGTFDPIHQGHISFANEAMKLCALEKVIFLPESEPREKVNVSSISTRLEKIKNAIKNYANLEVINLEESQFTINETLPKLIKMYPDSALTILIGSDVVKTFMYRWGDIEKLFSITSLAIGMRSGDNEEQIIETIENIEEKFGVKINYKFVYTDQMHVASSVIRKSTLSDTK